MMNYLFAVVYFSAAAGFYVLSGAAEGMTSPRIMISLIFLVSFFHAAIIIFHTIQKLFRAKTKISFDQLSIVISVIAVIVASKMGADIDDARIQKSMELGDGLLESIRKFKEQDGRCPIDLHELAADGVKVPTPALKSTKYKYYITNSGNCVVYFNSVLFMQCSKGLEDAEWYCDD